MATFWSCKRLFIPSRPWCEQFRSAFDPIFWHPSRSINGKNLQHWNKYNPPVHPRHLFWPYSLASLNPFWQTQAAYWKSLGFKEVKNLDYQYPVPLPTIPSKIPPIRLPFPQRFIWASESINSFVEHEDAEPAATLGEISQQLGVSLPVNKIAEDAEAREDILGWPLSQSL